MRKNYQTPECKTVPFKVEQLMAGSPYTIGGGTAGQNDGGFAKQGNGGTQFHFHDVWED